MQLAGLAVGVLYQPCAANPGGSFQARAARRMSRGDLVVRDDGMMVSRWPLFLSPWPWWRIGGGAFWVQISCKKGIRNRRCADGIGAKGIRG